MVKKALKRNLPIRSAPRSARAQSVKQNPSKRVKGRPKRKKPTRKRKYVQIEAALMKANENIMAKEVIETVIAAMKRSSNVFRDLFVKKLLPGGSFENREWNNNNLFRVYLLFKFPPTPVIPLLKKTSRPGFEYLHLENFTSFSTPYSELDQNPMENVVDKNEYLLTDNIARLLIENPFDDVMSTKLRDGVIAIGDEEYKLAKRLIIDDDNNTRMLRLCIKNISTHKEILVNLIPGFLIDQSQWPITKDIRKNPCAPPKDSIVVINENITRTRKNNLQDFFLIPQYPKKRSQYKPAEYFWKLCFEIQEQQLMHNKGWFKPTIRILKLVIIGYFKHDVSTYAIKTMCLLELEDRSRKFLTKRKLWASPFSFCVMHMLEFYLKCLKMHRIDDFWVPKINLLSELPKETVEQYQMQIMFMLRNIKKNSKCTLTVRKYLEL